MCLYLLKDKRNLAIWLSGAAGVDAIFHLVMAILNISFVLPELGITWDRIGNTISFAIATIISYILLHYASRKKSKN